jgi:hypothetical protein|nr:MAG TPA: hypothetical protein [Caudoviricetes sp.]
MRYEDDYYILDQEDHNFYASNEELNQCKNDLIDTKRIKFQRDVLLKDVYNYLGIQNFMRLTELLNRCPYNYYANDESKYKKEECDYHNCSECWEKIIRKLGE